ncbi:MAG: hypothetical protein M5R36_09195 [Deltaproteobacteria bacterium]|nr:hypothetical protein [Deltaproteobacteria bacterium]
MSADGRTLLASLREEQRVLAVDLDAGTSRGILNTQALVDGERRFLSWVEPENLVRLGGDDRFLLLAAVSDNEEENRVAEINASGDILRLVDAIPRTGVSDIVRDGQGRVYLSTEFEDKIFVLDETTLERVNEIAWPGAETNRVIVRPDRIFSLGLWWDGRVRVFDFTAKRETGSADVGTRSWDLAYDDATNRLYIPKMIAGNLLVVDAATMVLEARRRVGFGARPIEIDARRRRLLLGNMYDGRFTAYDLDTGDLVFETRLGGYLKGMIVDEKRGKAYTGCACGIFEIDLDVIG